MGEQERVRSFVAIEIPAEVKRKLAGLSESLRAEGVRASWVREANLHLSLRFLGEITTEERQQIESELAQVCVGIAHMQLAVEGCGAFPNARSPRVVWAGISGELEPLDALAVAVETAACSAGLEPMPKRFRPHVTLGRIRESGRVSATATVLEKHAEFSGGAIPVGRVSLFASELRPAGAKHTRLQSFELGLPE